MRRKRTSSGTSSRRKSRTRGRSGSGIRPGVGILSGQKPKAIRLSTSWRRLTRAICERRRRNNVSGLRIREPPRGYLLRFLRLLAERRVPHGQGGRPPGRPDGPLEGPSGDWEPAPPVEESPDVDETVAEKLFDSLLVEIQPAGRDEVPE